LEANPQIPERPVEYNQIEDRYRYCALHGPGFELIRGGNHARVLLNLHGVVVDVSVVRGEKRRVCMPLPRELNNVWAPLYGRCHIAYIVPKRLFLFLTDQLVVNYANVYVYRKVISPKIRT